MQEHLCLSLELYLIKNGCKCVISCKVVQGRKRLRKTLPYCKDTSEKSLSVCHGSSYSLTTVHKKISVFRSLCVSKNVFLLEMSS